jgi:uncharacterized small protein (DUF1192 family)
MLALYAEIARLEAELATCTDADRRRRLADDIWNLERDAVTHYE